MAFTPPPSLCLWPCPPHITYSCCAWLLLFDLCPRLQVGGTGVQSWSITIRAWPSVTRPLWGWIMSRLPTADSPVSEREPPWDHRAFLMLTLCSETEGVLLVAVSRHRLEFTAQHEDLEPFSSSPPPFMVIAPPSLSQALVCVSLCGFLHAVCVCVRERICSIP